VKNFFTVTLLAIGLPMILMGDEVRRTQRGNNNLYCHDDELAWLDWSLLERHRDVHRFVSLLNARRLGRSVRHEEQRLTLTELIDRATKAWHGVKLYQPDWGHDSHSLAFTVELPNEGRRAHFIFNAFWEALTFELPPAAAGRPWRRWIDTALDSPNDIVPWEEAPAVAGDGYRAEGRSVVVLFADLA
jgi:glycogen operon protein